MHRMAHLEVILLVPSLVLGQYQRAVSCRQRFHWGVFQQHAPNQLALMRPWYALPIALWFQFCQIHAQQLNTRFPHRLTMAVMSGFETPPHALALGR